MKKFMVFLGITLFCLTALTACGGGNLTKNYTTLAKDFTVLLYESDYEGALAYVDAAMGESITADALKEITAGTTAEYGAFEEITAVAEITMDDYLRGLGLTDEEASALNSLNCTVVVETLRFASSEMYLYLIFDTADREIVGINVYGKESIDGSGAALTEQEIRATARTFLEAVFSGDADTVSDRMSETLQNEMGVKEFKRLMAETSSLYGDFDEVGQIIINGREAIAYVSFEEGEINAYLTFDSDGLIVSFFTDTPH